MAETFNIARHYGGVAAQAADFPALIGDGIALSHGQFWDVTRTLAAHLHRGGVGPGSLVVLNSRTTLVVLATAMATALLGAGFANASPVLAAAQKIRPTHFYRTADLTGHPSVPFRVLDLNWLSPDPAAIAALPVFETDADAPWLNLYTSGTTGAPKFITLSQRMVFDRSRAVADDFVARTTTFATTFPCTSRPFMARAMAALLGGCAIVDGQDTGLWLRNGVDFVAGSPMQLLTLLGEVPLPRRIARLEVSGAPLPPGAAVRYLQSFDEVVDVYGASETSKSFATRLTLTPDGRIHRIGMPRDSQIEIVRDDLTPCDTGEVGRVRVKNDYSVDHYLGDPGASAKSFMAGWFYPGDLAFWGEDGDLSIVGREDDVINIGGLKLLGGMLDSLVKTVPGVQDALVLRNPIPGALDVMIAFVVFEAGVDPVVAKEGIVAAVRKAFGFSMNLKNIKVMDDVPRDSSGAPSRREAERLVLTKARELGEVQ